MDFSCALPLLLFLSFDFLKHDLIKKVVALVILFVDLACSDEKDL